MRVSLGGHCQRLASGLPALALALLGGCDNSGDELPRQEVSGTVSLAGEPLADGMIQFRPMADPGTFASAAIKEGKYTIPRTEGPVAGGYQVIITSPPPSTAAAGDGGPGKTPPPPPDRIPKKYNAASTLNAEVKAGDPNTFNFDLKK